MLQYKLGANFVQVLNSHLSRLLAVVPHDIAEQFKPFVFVGSVGRLFFNDSVEFAKHRTNSIGVKAHHASSLK